MFTFSKSAKKSPGEVDAKKSPEEVDNDPWTKTIEGGTSESTSTQPDSSKPRLNGNITRGKSVHRSPYGDRLEDEHVSLIEDIRKQRGRVLGWAIISTSILLLFTGAIIVWNMIATGGKSSTELLTTWIVSILAACIAIIASVAKYLFAELVSILTPVGSNKDQD